MRSFDRESRELPQSEMTALIAEVRSATHRLSREQILDLADVLHDVIRERQFEARSWRRLHGEARTTVHQ